MGCVRRLVFCLGLLLAVLGARPAPAESGGMTVDRKAATWTESTTTSAADGTEPTTTTTTDEDGTETTTTTTRNTDGTQTTTVTKKAVKAGLNLTVLFIGPEDANIRFPGSLMDRYKPIFEKVAEILYDVTEGDVYIKTIAFTNVPESKSDADLVFRPFLDHGTSRALAMPNGWDFKSDNANVALVLEQHICDQDNERETFDVLRAAYNELQKTAGSDGREVPCDSILDDKERARCQTGQFLADLCKCGHRAPFGIAHELGHYLFGLSDEYSGELWNNCNTANSDCPACPIVPNSECDEIADEAERAKCKREQDRVVVPILGERTFTLAAGGALVETMEISRELRDLVVTLDLDTGQFPSGKDSAQEFPNGKASAQVTFEILRPGGVYVGDDVPEGETVKIDPVPKEDAAGNYIPACERASGVTDPNADPASTQTFDFVDSGTQKIWTITNPGGGNWRAVIRSKSASAQVLKFAYRANYKCSFRCAARSTDGSGSCEATTADSNEACVMDGGTTTTDRNERREYCTAHGVDPSTGHDAGVAETDLSDDCRVVYFVNDQELGPGHSCWHSLSNSRFRRELLLGLSVLDGDTPLTDEFLQERARALTTDGLDGDALIRLLRRRSDTSRQVLPEGLKPRFIATPNATDAATADDGAALQALHAIETEYITGPPGYMICIDTSRSMGDKHILKDGTETTKLALAVQAVRDSISLLKDAEKFSVISFSDGISTIQPLDSGIDVRDAFVEKVTEEGTDLFPLGNRTAMGDCLVEAHDIVRDLRGDAMSSKAIVLVSDGRSNVGLPILDALAVLQNTHRLKVHTVGLGSAADVEALEEIARKTGGAFWFAANPAELGLIMPRIFAAIRGEEELFVSSQVVDASATNTTPMELNPFLSDVTFLLSTKPGDDLVFTVVNQGADGAPVTYGENSHDPDSGVEFSGHATQQYLRLQDPRGGTWTLTVENKLGQSAAYQLQVVGGSTRLSIGTQVRADGPLDYPTPIIVETIIGAPTRMTGLDVEMVVTHPGPDKIQSRVIPMFDDGRKESGDRVAGDGVFTALFAEYMGADGNGNGGDGAYVINVTAENTAELNGSQVPADDGTPLQPSIPVRERFIILDEVCTLVRGIPRDVRDGYTVLGRIDEGVAAGLPPGPKRLKVGNLDVTPVFRFSLQPGLEWLLLERVTVNLTVKKTTPPVGVELIEMVGLYADKNQDGQVDSRLRPLAWGRFDEVGETAADTLYQVTFDLGRVSGTQRQRFLAMLQEGDTHHFLVTLGQPGPRNAFTTPTLKPGFGGGGVVRWSPTPSAPTSPVLLLGLAGLALLLLLATHRLGAPRLVRQTTTAGFAAMLFVLFLAMGCGGGGGGPDTGGGGGPFPPLPPVYTGPFEHKPKAAIAGFYTFSMAPSGVTVRSVRGDLSQEGALGRPTVGGAVASAVILEN